MTAPARIAADARSLNLDVLRGVAILFILTLNIPYSATFATLDFVDPRLPTWTGLDQAAWWATELIDGTQRGLLQLLFGAGVMIMTRAAEPGTPPGVAGLHVRRNVLLMVFGLFHGLVLLWPGDILLSYGFAALLLFPFRKLAGAWQLAIGVGLILMAQFGDIQGYTSQLALERDAAAAAARGDTTNPALLAWREQEAIYRAPDPDRAAVEIAGRQGDLAAYVALTHAAWVAVQFTQEYIFFLNLYEGFATMLIGAALWRWGILQGRAPPATCRWLLLGGYGLGLALRVHGGLDELRFTPQAGSTELSGQVSRVLVTIGHVAALNLALMTATGMRLLGVFAANGKLPLTTYMGASIVMIFVFAGFGLGLWGRYGVAGYEGIALLIIAAQLAGANLWLRHFATGPAEWLWKSLAYGRRQPFRRAIAGTEVTA